ncbi:MAG: hypothetical protein PHQ50_02610 [Eubacteriales bacterium]|nr:hypothetical protein [Eubacteriales bacterium]MDD3349825.1 hypothetical protein [Eubacteriales bacterium]
MILSTHLIEEVSGVIEDVVIIDEGEILRQATQEELLAEAFMLSGTSTAVDQFAEGKKVLGTEAFGGLKTIYLGEEVDRTTLPENLELSKMDLQRYFIQLTNKERGRIS